MANGKLKLTLVDVHDKPLKGTLDLTLRSKSLSHKVMKKNLDASKKITITALESGAHGLYQLDVDPSNYLPVTRPVNIKSGDGTEARLVFPVDPDKVVSVDFKKFAQLSKDLRDILNASSNVLDHMGQAGATLYDALDDISRAGLLNISAKCATTLLTNDKTVLSLIKEMRELRGDRLFAIVPKELREATKNSAIAGLLDQVPDQHHNIPGQFPGFTHAGSFKTQESAGNLQLTFFMKGDDCIADIDIDDAGGLGHVFQVLRNFLLHRRTHPFDIHEILIARHQLIPDYQFNLDA